VTPLSLAIVVGVVAGVGVVLVMFKLLHLVEICTLGCLLVAIYLSVYY